MTHKRFIKLLMADGRTRNEANFNALTARMYGYSYDDAYELIEHYGMLFSPDQTRQAVQLITDAIPRVIEAVSAAFSKLGEAFNNLAKKMSETSQNLRQNSDE